MTINIKNLILILITTLNFINHSYSVENINPKITELKNDTNYPFETKELIKNINTIFDTFFDLNCKILHSGKIFYFLKKNNMLINNDLDTDIENIMSKLLEIYDNEYKILFLKFDVIKTTIEQKELSILEEKIEKIKDFFEDQMLVRTIINELLSTNKYLKFLENFFIEPVEENDEFIFINYSKIYKFLINESLTEYDLPLENIYKKLDTILNDQITKEIFEEFGNVNKKQYIKFRLLKQNKEIIDYVKIIINILLQEHHRQMDLSSGFKKYFYKNIRIFFNDINIHKRREIKALQESQQKQLKNEILVSFLRKPYENPPINYYEKNSFLKFSKYYLETGNMTFFYFFNLRIY